MRRPDLILSAAHHCDQAFLRLALALPKCPGAHNFRCSWGRDGHFCCGCRNRSLQPSPAHLRELRVATSPAIASWRRSPEQHLRQRRARGGQINRCRCTRTLAFCISSLSPCVAQVAFRDKGRRHSRNVSRKSPKPGKTQSNLPKVVERGPNLGRMRMCSADSGPWPPKTWGEFGGPPSTA